MCACIAPPRRLALLEAVVAAATPIRGFAWLLRGAELGRTLPLLGFALEGRTLPLLYGRAAMGRGSFLGRGGGAPAAWVFFTLCLPALLARAPVLVVFLVRVLPEGEGSLVLRRVAGEGSRVGRARSAELARALDEEEMSLLSRRSELPRRDAVELEAVALDPPFPAEAPLVLVSPRDEEALS